MVELVVVLGVLAIISTGAIILIKPANYLRKTADTERKADLKLMQSALELYRNNEGGYPAVTGNSLAMCSGSLVGLEDGSCPADLSTANVYIQSVPKDPKLNTNYYYVKDTPVNGYTIYACIENTSDSEAVSPTNAATIKAAMSCNNSNYALYSVQNL